MPENGSCASSTNGARRAGSFRSTSPSTTPIARRAGGSSSRTSSPGSTARFPTGSSPAFVAMPRRPPAAPRSATSRWAASRREIWNGFQVDGVATAVVAAGRPYLAPLMRMLDDGSPVGVIVVSLEGVRVLDWALGEIEELDGWELEITSLDWHERKAPRRDPARGTGTSASGRDQHAQRLEHNRERFLKQAGGLVVIPLRRPPLAADRRHRRGGPAPVARRRDGLEGGARARGPARPDSRERRRRSTAGSPRRSSSSTAAARTR